MPDPHIALFSQVGQAVIYLLLFLGIITGLSGVINLVGSRAVFRGVSLLAFGLANAVFVAGFLWIGWFHYQIYSTITLDLPGNLAALFNSHLGPGISSSSYGMPPIDPLHPPRYTLPLWIENEKYYFWFMCYGLMALFAHLRIRQHRIRALLYLLFSAQVMVLFAVADPFNKPLPGFFSEISPWFEAAQTARVKINLFMRLYPRMVYYYNASWMWVHPPLLFISYACISIMFVTSLFMLVSRDPVVELTGYDFARFGFLMLTIGMLIGYPWALEAWGENWWWDPKICSSIMMWAVFSTYLHTRLYAVRKGMWYFTAALGILCYLAMLFTFASSLFFPGEHTFQ